MRKITPFLLALVILSITACSLDSTLIDGLIRFIRYLLLRINLLYRASHTYSHVTIVVVESTYLGDIYYVLRLCSIEETCFRIIAYCITYLGIVVALTVTVRDK